MTATEERSDRPADRPSGPGSLLPLPAPPSPSASEADERYRSGFATLLPAVPPRHRLI